jgi:tRNA (cytidine/uridine-2'-O-)-methyltransferase
LHLVGPLGFSIDDRQLKRAGLDYWDEVDIREWSSLDELQRANASARFFYLTTKATQPYFEVRFQPKDFLVFGRETKGLPERVLEENRESCITIPMHGTRSLNLATAVAIVLFEAMRQQRG